jgi:anti-sigma B factor antagonist
MEIAQSKTGSINNLMISGKLDAYSSGDLEKKLDSLINEGSVQFVVSLEKVEYISSSGLRVFLAGLKKVKKQNGDIKLACMQPNIKEVFDIAGFTQLFNIFNTVDSANESFK